LCNQLKHSHNHTHRDYHRYSHDFSGHHHHHHHHHHQFQPHYMIIIIIIYTLGSPRQCIHADTIYLPCPQYPDVHMEPLYTFFVALQDVTDEMGMMIMMMIMFLLIFVDYHHSYY